MLRLEHADAYEYTAARIDYWLRHIDELMALADNPNTAIGLLIPGPTPETPRVGARQKGFHGDPLAYANVLADVKSAAGQLTGFSMEWYAVQARMQGWSLGLLAARANWRRDDVQDACERATVRMAAILNGEATEPDDFEVVDRSPRQCAADGCSNVVGPKSRFCSSRCRLRTWRTKQQV